MKDAFEQPKLPPCAAIPGLLVILGYADPKGDPRPMQFSKDRAEAGRSLPSEGDPETRTWARRSHGRLDPSRFQSMEKNRIAEVWVVLSLKDEGGR